jgi:hypothetical protein
LVSASEGLVALLLSGGGITLAELSVLFVLEPALLSQAVTKMALTASAAIKCSFFIIYFLDMLKKIMPVSPAKQILMIFLIVAALF